MRPPKSTTPISQAATDLIVSYEVTSESYYSAHYQQPAWPGGASGVTIGIGYDLGYQVAADFEEDWASYLDAVTLAGLATVLEQSQPRTIAETEAALENTGELSPDSLGALVSLVYNRGTSFDAPGPRYLEMRKIKALMAAKQFEQIPDQIRAMKRLWPTVPGLQRRRDAEADLFQSGLGA
jgi:GH24 family phage-related lysozyme (muramidase)